MEPPVGTASPVVQWMRVDLPAPLGPSRPKKSPSPMFRETPRSASVPVGYRLTRSLISSAMVIAQSTIGRLPPGPRLPAPLQTFAALARQRPWSERNRRRYGNIVTYRVIGFGTFVVVADPQLIRQVFTEDPTVLHVGGNQNPLGPVL